MILSQNKHFVNGGLDGGHNKKPAVSGWFLRNIGGGGGIRTLEALRLTHFPGVLLRPLGHPSAFFALGQGVAFPYRTARILCAKTLNGKSFPQSSQNCVGAGGLKAENVVAIKLLRQRDTALAAGSKALGKLLCPFRFGGFANEAIVVGHRG